MAEGVKKLDTGTTKLIVECCLSGFSGFLALLGMAFACSDLSAVTNCNTNF